MTQTYFDTHPWAINIYAGNTHVLTEYFKHEPPARFYLNNVALLPGQSAHLMKYQGNFTWTEKARRERKLTIPSHTFSAGRLTHEQ